MMAAESYEPRPPGTSCGRAGEVAVAARFRPGGMLVTGAGFVLGLRALAALGS